MPTVFDPYRESNERTTRWPKTLSLEKKIALLKKCGIFDKRGNLARKYRTRKEEPFRVGERVRFMIGWNEVVAKVVADRGPILGDGRRLVLVSFRTDEGARGELEIFSNEVAREAATGASAERRTSTKPVLSSVSSRRRGTSPPRRVKEAKSAKPKAASSVARKRAAS